MKFDKLRGFPDIEIFENHDMTKMSTMRLKAKGDLVIVKSVEALKLFIENYKDYQVIGWGANQLLKQSVDHPYLKLEFPFDRSVLSTYQETYTLPASVSLASLTSCANRLGLKDWEVFTGIPASLGGAIAMNAGTGLGEMALVTKSFRYISRNGEDHEVICDDKAFSYRENNVLRPGDIVYEATLKHSGKDPKTSEIIKDYLKYRNSSQPMSAWTCGCIFKNYSDAKTTCRAGQSLDTIGLKGFTYKNLRVSPKHANFIENMGDSTYEDVMELIKILKEKLKAAYGVDFEVEVR